MNFTIIDQLHETELAALNLRTKNEIRTTLKLLRQLLAEAKWNHQVTGFLDGYESILVEERDSGVETREAWRTILGKLESYETGQPLTKLNS